MGANMRLRRLSSGMAIWALVGLAFALSCSASSSSTGVRNQGDSSSGGVGATGNATGSQPGFVISDASKNSGGATSIVDGEAVPCTNGDDCICPTLSVAVIGTRGQWGAQGNSSGLDSDTAFQDWLNSSSAGTARVDNYATKPALTRDFLAGYNVIILGGLGDNSDTGPWWTFDATTEIPAVAEWVRKGGGLISLSGYSGDPSEVTAKNALLAFTGISYNTDRVGPPCPIYQICGCSAGAAPITDWVQSDPVVANLSLGVTMIGEVGGHSINAPANAHVAATTPNGTSLYNLLVGEVVEQGRVLAYSDEWITYTSQWTGVGNPSTSDPSCTGFLPQDRFQTAQFWYNMIRWSQPNATCFKIVDKKQPVTIW